MLKVLDEICKPTKGSRYSAAIDLYSAEDIVIAAGETKIIPLGVCIDKLGIKKIISEHYHYKKENINKNFKELEETFLKSHYLQLEPRSSLRAKGLIAGTGIIDLDYKDEIKIILHNFSGEQFTINKHDKIAQIMLKEHQSFLFRIDTENERVGGLGSTGK